MQLVPAQGLALLSSSDRPTVALLMLVLCIVSALRCGLSAAAAPMFLLLLFAMIMACGCIAGCYQMITQQMPAHHCRSVAPSEPDALNIVWSCLLQGRQDDAEAAWEFACNSISVGCRRYGDLDWLSRIRRCARSLPCHLSLLLHESVSFRRHCSGAAQV